MGIHSAQSVSLTLKPAEINSGIFFTRSDLGVSIPLCPDYITDTSFCTTIAKNDIKIATIEHLLSAICAYGIDNIEIIVDNEEVPITDGSAIAFCMLLDEAGLVSQNAPKKIIIIKKTIEVKDGNKFVRFKPALKNELSFEIDFQHPAIRQQKYNFLFNKSNYIKEIAKSRTFGFTEDLKYLQSQNKAKGANLNNVIALDEYRILNKEGLRYKDEFVRHKILDAIGDMRILQHNFFGKYEAFASSHKLNFDLVQEVLNTADAYEVVEVTNKAKTAGKNLAYAYQTQ